MSNITAHPLHLIAGELNTTLTEARQALETYAERQQQTECLDVCANRLHLAQGALRVVEVYGAALLAEEMEHVCRFLEESARSTEERSDALEALTRGMVQLPVYIERVQNGGRDLALVLLPLLNDLRASRRRTLLSEGTLLLLNLTPDSRASVGERQSGALDVDISQLGRRVRSAYQRALLGWIRGEQPEGNLERMARAAEALERAARTDHVYQLWWVIGGVLEALRDDGLETSVAIKRLLAQADLQIKRLIDQGESAFAAEPAIELLNNLLYYVGRANSKAARVAAIQSSFSLAELLPADEQVEFARESLSAPSIKLMETVASAIKEDLSRVKDVLDIYVRTGMGRVDELAPQLDLLKKISDTLGVLGLGDLRGHVQYEIAQLQEIVANEAPADDATLVKMASTLLSVEDNLDGQLMRLITPSDTADEPHVDDGDTVRALEFRQVTEAVIRECIVNLARVKEAVIQSIDDPADAQLLDGVPALLRGIMAGLLMLNKTRGVELVERLGGFINEGLRPGRRPLSQVKLDLMADAIVSIEYYMETIQAGRSDPWYMLDNAEACIESLAREPDEVELPDAADPTVYARTVTLESSAEVAESRRRDADATRVLEAPDHGLVGGADEKPQPDVEFIELFIEEAREEAASIQQTFPAWYENPADAESLKTLRRSFHTLKGSGRMVGADRIGEFAWAIENVLNRVINGTLERGSELMELMERAVSAVPQLIEHLETGTPTEADIAGIMSAAAALADVAPMEEATAESEPAGLEEPPIDPVLREIFSKETSEHLEVVRRFIDDCRSLDPPYAVTESLYRACHTLSGSANMAGVERAAAVAGPWSAYIRHLHDNDGRLDRRDLDACEQVVEAIEHVVASLGAAPAPVRDHGLLIEHIRSLRLEFDGQLAQRAAVLRKDVTDTRVEAGELVTGIDPEDTAAFAVQPDADEALTGGDEAGEVLFEADSAEARGPEREAGQPVPPEAHEGAAFQVSADEQVEAEPVARDDHPVAADGSETTSREEGAEVAATAGDDTAFDLQIAAVYGEEAIELLNAADRAVAALAEGQDEAAQIGALLRHLHTLKGGARMAGAVAMADLSHELETLLEAIEAERAELSHSNVELLQQSVDELHRMRDRLARGEEPTQPSELMRRLRGDSAPPREVSPTARFDESDARTEIPAAIRRDKEPADATHELLDDREEEAAAAGFASEAREDWGDALPAVPVAPRREDRQEYARVDADLLEDLMNHAGEISIYRSRLQQQLNSINFNLAELTRTITRLRDQLRALEGETEAQILHRHQDDSGPRRDFDPLELDRYSTIQQLSRALAESASDVGSIRDLLESLTTDTESLLVQQGRVTTELQNGLMRTRMVPFSRHAQRLNRIVRLAATETGKRAELALEGATGELDRQITERMLSPLEHLLRNAVIHGIEPAETRHSLGKPETGQIRISLRREGSEMVIEVHDDGAGLDVDRIKQRAIEQGLIQPNQRMSDETAMELILKPGFSTAHEVTQAAGRGVGMDIVASEVQKLGGSLRIASRPHEGTQFIIRLPFMLAISQVLVVRVGEERFALPLPTVEGVARLKRSAIEQHLAEEVPSFSYGGQKYRFQHLGLYLDSLPSALPEEDTYMSVVLVRAGDHSTALITDEMLGSQEIVVKPVGPQIASIKGITGATILGDGSIVIIIDAGVLVREVQPAHYLEGLEAADKEDNRSFILVIDDSITMRRVTQRFLERNGMRVMTAKDGIDAMAILQEQKPDVILLDIEMPRMDGYELASYVRNDERLKDTPIIMVTSRVSDKHRARAIELGVNDYLGKPYQETQLLHAIEPLIGDEQRALA
ncbi:hypothetical protein BH24PSE2_BH24PSE2_08610 [soil metagenome]